MRALRVVGLGADATQVVLEDPTRQERFSVAADERLRAAARGDATRLGQIEIELESQLRPREIQARIRAGASVEQVAAAAGLPFQRIDRFAYPVLLERSRTAELAQQAHPVRADGPDVRTLGEVVAHTFGLRGADYPAAEWDSWRGEDGKWVVVLRWQAGRSDNEAHWTYHPGAHGGTVTALDEPAVDLVEGLPARPLRTVRPVTPLGHDPLGATVDQRPRPDELPVDDGAAEPRAAEPPAVETPAAETRAPVTPASGSGAPPPAATDPQVAVSQTATPQSASQPDPAAATGKPAAKGGRKSHPVVPAWEDVLLGVRGQRG